jgi:16S rRNA processing protein RimM
MPHQTRQNRTVVGKLTSAYGIKGWIKVHSYTDPPENIFKYGQWFLADSNGNAADQEVGVDDFRHHGTGLVVHIKGTNTRDQASLLCQRLVVVDMGELPPLPPGEYYWQQLKGLQVLSCYGGNESNPVLLGQIKDLMETGANDVIVVEPCDSSIDNRERLLPYVEDFVLKVDLESGTMLVDWDPGF